MVKIYTEGCFEMTQKIKIILIKRKMTIKELADKLGYSPTNLSNKLRRDNFPTNELKKIADCLDCDFEASFVMRDTGEKV